MNATPLAEHGPRPALHGDALGITVQGRAVLVESLRADADAGRHDLHRIANAVERGEPVALTRRRVALTLPAAHLTAAHYVLSPDGTLTAWRPPDDDHPAILDLHPYVRHELARALHERAARVTTGHEERHCTGLARTIEARSADVTLPGWRLTPWYPAGSIDPEADYRLTRDGQLHRLAGFRRTEGSLASAPNTPANERLNLHAPPPHRHDHDPGTRRTRRRPHRGAGDRGEQGPT